MWERLVLVVVVAACGSNDPTPAPAAAPPPPPTQVVTIDAAPAIDAAPPPPPMPMPIAFGDCKGATSVWHSGGPRPPPYDPLSDPEVLKQLGRMGSANDVNIGDNIGNLGQGGGLRIDGSQGPPGGSQGAPAGGRRYFDPNELRGIGGPVTADVRIGNPVIVEGAGRELAVIRRVLMQHRAQFTGCYARTLTRNPSARGTMQVHFVITSAGLAVSPQVNGIDGETDDCFGNVLRNLQFPKVQGDETMVVTAPFTLTPREADPPQPQADHYHHPPAPPPAPPPPPQPNPLRDDTDALAACFRAGPVHAGAIVVELAYAKDKPATATVHGLADDTERACVAAVAATAKPSDPKIAAQRCPLAFGALAADAATAIDLAATMPDDKTLGPALVKLAPAVAADAKAVIVVGPAVVLRPDPAASMALVWHAIDALAPTRDVVLAARRGDRWEILTPSAIPTVPAPHGTVWTAARRAAPPGSVKLALPNVDVGKALAALRAASPKATTLALVPGTKVTYADVVAAVDAATAAGFTAWVLVP